MMNRLIILLCLTALLATAQNTSERKIGSTCEDCKLMLEGIPAQLQSQTKISDKAEPGEPMTISGTIYKRDGKTPAPNVILYVYHTDAKGIYSPAPGQTEGVRHGHLRGWIKTDNNGQYSFTTIRPASYPNSKAPQHIHPIIKEPGVSYYWIDEFLFDDDPQLTRQEISQQQKRGGSGIIHLTKNENGVWTGKRNITLGLNIPGY